jgi:hypothetical protein
MNVYTGDTYKNAHIRMFGIIFINASYNFVPLSNQKVRQSVEVLNVLRELVTTRSNCKESTIKVFTFGDFAQVFSSMLSPPHWVEIRTYQLLV